MRAEEDTGPSPRRRPAVVLAVVLATLAAYARVPGHALLSWDDRVMVVENPWISPPTLRGTLEPA